MEDQKHSLNRKLDHALEDEAQFRALEDQARAIAERMYVFEQLKDLKEMQQQQLIQIQQMQQTQMSKQIQQQQLLQIQRQMFQIQQIQQVQQQQIQQQIQMHSRLSPFVSKEGNHG